eukprot:1867656-Prymnesium_polylepis.1
MGTTLELGVLFDAGHPAAPRGALKRAQSASCNVLIARAVVTIGNGIDNAQAVVHVLVVQQVVLPQRDEVAQEGLRAKADATQPR